MAQQGYRKFKDQAFWVRRNDLDLLVLPVKFIDEIRKYTREQLSGVEALAFNVLGDLNGINILVESDLHVKVLRTYLTSNMGKVMSNAQDELNYSWEKDLPKCADWEEIDFHRVIKQIVARLSARTFIGYPSCRDEKYIQTSLDYARDVFQLTMIMHWLPRPLHPIVCPFVPARWRLNKHRRYAHKILEPAIQQWNNAASIGAVDGEPFTLLDGMLKEAKGPERNTEEIVLRQMISSLASIHTTCMATVFCLLELCRHPEYKADLTKEATYTILQNPDWAKDSTSRMPKLDSFICEVLRCHPPSILIPQRRAKIAFTLSNGVHVPMGTQFCFPLGPITNDPSVYPNPEQFNGYRNLHKRVQENLVGHNSKYMATTPSKEHLIFGYGIQACPGRYFAVNELKLIISYFLMNYEFEQPKQQRGRSFHFPYEEYFLPNPSLTLMMRRKEGFGKD